MSAPKRIKLSRAKGFRLPDGAVNVARPGRWGNPFVVGRDGTRAQVVWRYAQLALGFINLGCNAPSVELQELVQARLATSVKDLAGHDLACWCPLDGPCHGDVLLHLANGGAHVALVDRYFVELPRVGLGMMADDLRAGKIEAALKAEDSG